MSIHPSASEANVMSAVVTHLKTTIGGVGGFPSKVPEAEWWWPGEPFNPDEHDTYIRVSIIAGTGEAFAAVPDDLAGEPDDETPGEIRPWFVFMDLYRKRACEVADLSFWPRCKDLVREGFTGVGQLKLPVLDLHRPGSTGLEVGCLKLMGRSPRPLQPDADWLSFGWAVQLEAIEVDSAV